MSNSEYYDKFLQSALELTRLQLEQSFVAVIGKAELAALVGKNVRLLAEMSSCSYSLIVDNSELKGHLTRTKDAGSPQGRLVAIENV